MKIAIIGATGPTGRSFIDQAVAAGHDVLALARNPSKLTNVASSVVVRKADARDVDSLVAALGPEIEVVVNIVGASGLLEARNVTDLYSVAAQNLVAAMNKVGIERIVTVSSGGVEPQPNDGWFYTHVLKRFFLEPMYVDMRRMEAVIRSSATRWTILRPPYLVGGAVTGRYRMSIDAPLPDDGSLRRADLAHFILRVVQEPGPFERHWVSLSE